jgi:RimJ/RimL family protein N-acetyltransferase
MISHRFTTDRLLIRSVVEADTQELYEKILSDPEVMWYDGARVSADLEDARARVKRFMEWEQQFGMSFWTVTLKQTGEIISNCGLLPVEAKGPEVELGYDTAKQYWHQGYTSEAAEGCLRYGFETLKLDRIISITDEENTGSWKVMEKIGMRRMGFSDKYYDSTCLVYECTPSDIAKHPTNT